jgi:hypothetical protein
MMMIFFIGIIEMLIVTAWTQTVTNMKVLASGSITVINVLIWYYVLENIVSNLGNFWVVLFYALGCAIGTMIGTYYLGCKNNPSKFSFWKKFGRVNQKKFSSQRKFERARKTKAKASRSLKSNLEASILTH